MRKREIEVLKSGGEGADIAPGGGAIFGPGGGGGGGGCFPDGDAIQPAYA